MVVVDSFFFNFSMQLGPRHRIIELYGKVIKILTDKVKFFLEELDANVFVLRGEALTCTML